MTKEKYYFQLMIFWLFWEKVLAILFLNKGISLDSEFANQNIDTWFCANLVAIKIIIIGLISHKHRTDLSD